MEKHTLVITLVLLLIGFVVGFQFIYLPKMEAIRSLEELQKEEEEKGVLSDEVTKLEKQLVSYEKRLFPKGKEEIELLNRVREIASDTGVRVTSIIPQEVRDKRKRTYQKFLLTISFAGTYHHVGDFVSKIESSEKVMKIDALEFSVPHKGENPLLECDVTLSIASIP